MKHYKDSNNQIWAFELDGSQDHLIKDDMVYVTDEQADIIREENRAAADALFKSTLDYKQLRQFEYPSIGDQLDALFHAGVFPESMAATIRAIKEKYPKQ